MLTFSKLGEKGGLGNQLFQFSSLAGIAKNRGLEWGFPSLTKSGRAPEILSYFEMSDYWIGNHDSREISYTKYFSKLNRFRDTTGVKFDQRLYSRIPDNSDIDAYLQSEKYFFDYRDYIKSQLRVKSEFLLEPESFVHPYIGVHVRRGDYTSLRHTHYLLNSSYYEQALEMLPDIWKIICTDDIDWVSSQKVFSKSDCELVSSNAINDFQILQHADYHVIANSSFSWWAAWLSKSKSVIAPARWFGWSYPPSSSSDIVPSRWIRI